MKILIVGGGIAGLTLAALLAQRGVNPTIVEKAPSYEDVGYMLGLYPIGSDVLHGLGLYKEYEKSSVEMKTYEIRNGHGDIVHSYPLDSLNDMYGPLRGISRKELIDVLLLGTKGLPIKMNTTVKALSEKDDVVEVTFNTGDKDTFDLVVGCDGINSEIRKLLFEKPQPKFDTHWGGWIWWLDPDLVPSDQITEHWAAGRMVGVYPCKGRVGCFTGCSIKGLDEKQFQNKDWIKEKFKLFGGQVPQYLEQLEKTKNPYFIRFYDIRSKNWYQGRVILIGDSAAAFLPTAGVGASMALNSAAALNDVLSRTDAKRIPHALMLYEKRIRNRIERCQDQSRNLAKLMFVDSVPMAFGREFLMHFYTVDMLLKDIKDVMDEPL